MRGLESRFQSRVKIVWRPLFICSWRQGSIERPISWLRQAFCRDALVRLDNRDVSLSSTVLSALKILLICIALNVVVTTSASVASIQYIKAWSRSTSLSRSVPPKTLLLSRTTSPLPLPKKPPPGKNTSSSTTLLVRTTIFSSNCVLTSGISRSSTTS